MSENVIAAVGDDFEDAALPTCGELERRLSQSIQALYGQRLGHLPSRVTCHLFAQEVALIVENSTTLMEHFLSEQGVEQLALQVRKAVDSHFKQEIALIIEAVTGVAVCGLMVDTDYAVERTGILATLAKTPTVRNPDHVPKTDAFRRSRRRRL